MSRNLLFMMMLLATSVVLAADAPQTERAATAAEEKAQTEEGAERVAGAAEEKTQTEDEAKPSAGPAEEKAQKEEGAKLVSGMSILGNQEAPKSLVIVPWKSSEIGDSLGISTLLDDSRQPIDREVFMRALNYYQIRSDMKE
jgi:hypothetical protein